MIGPHNLPMTRDRIISALRLNQDHLRALGVEGLALFGSVARGDDTPQSDIDLAVIYNETKVLDLFDMGGIAATIEALIGTDNFDLAEEKRLMPHVRERFGLEHVRIF
jgi:uncharacterized protein